MTFSPIFTRKYPMKSSLPPSAVRDFLVERLDVLLAECDQVADTAAYGQTLNDLDDFLLINGRTFIKEVLQAKLQERIDRTEAASESKQCPHCKKNARRE